MAKSPQKVVIKIGHMSIMLPDDTGAAQVLKTLSRGVVVWHFASAYSSVQIRDEELEVGMTYLSDKTKFTNERDEPVKPATHAKKKGATLALKAPELLALTYGKGESNHGS